jgi:hypothetical protein
MADRLQPCCQGREAGIHPAPTCAAPIGYGLMDAVWAQQGVGPQLASEDSLLL